MPKVSALRGTGAEGTQWIEVHYADFGDAIQVIAVGPDISSGGRFRKEIEGEYLGKTFESPDALSRALNGDNAVG